MKFNKFVIGVFYSSLITGCILPLSGCDGGGGSDEHTHQEPAPPSPPAPPEPPSPVPPAPPVENVPAAQSITVKSLLTSEKFEGAYRYSDTLGRQEGHSGMVWRDASNHVIGEGPQLSINEALHNSSARFCITPVTFDGVKGAESCSQSANITFDSQPLQYSTDWNTDTDYIHDDETGDIRNGSSGNVHFYYNINITPAMPEKYSPGQLTAESETPVSRQFYDTFNMDNVYASVDDAGTIWLQNNTPRYIADPVIRINEDNYYVVKGFTLNAFTNVTLSGYTGADIKAITFMDTNPAWKLNVADFLQDADVNKAARISPQVPYLHADKKEEAKRYKKYIGGRKDAPYTFGAVNDVQAQQYMNVFRLNKLLYNRMDTIKYYFETLNGGVNIEGQQVGIPYTEENGWVAYLACEKTEVSNDPDITQWNACGANNVVAPYAYRMHALKRILSHEPDTEYKILLSDSEGADGRADIATGPTPGSLAAAASNFSASTEIVTPSLFDTANHENAHRQGYSDSSGVTLGWSDWGGIDYIFANSGIVPLNENGDFDLSETPKEQSDYFADYHWVDNQTVDVHFYSKGSTAPIRNIAVIADDEESWRTFPNFFGRFDACDDPVDGWGGWTDVSDCQTFTRYDPDGSLQLAPEMEVLNGDSVRIHLKKPVENYSRNIMLFASSADMTEDSGQWKKDYTRSIVDSFAIQIPYDREMIIPDEDHGVVYATSLASWSTVRGGNSGHIGRDKMDDLGAPDFTLKSALYKGYSEVEANQHCIDLGYSGLGRIPFATGSEDGDALGTLIYRHVYEGIAVGLDHESGTTPVMIRAKRNENYRPMSEIDGNPADRATLIVCQN